MKFTVLSYIGMASLFFVGQAGCCPSHSRDDIFMERAWGVAEELIWAKTPLTTVQLEGLIGRRAEHIVSVENLPSFLTKQGFDDNDVIEAMGVIYSKFLWSQERNGLRPTNSTASKPSLATEWKKDQKFLTCEVWLYRWSNPIKSSERTIVNPVKSVISISFLIQDGFVIGVNDIDRLFVGGVSGNNSIREEKDAKTDDDCFPERQFASKLLFVVMVMDAGGQWRELGFSNTASRTIPKCRMWAVSPCFKISEYGQDLATEVESQKIPGLRLGFRMCGADLKILKKEEFKELKWLSLLEASGINDEDLSCLGNLKELRGLDLRCIRITDAGLVHLKGLSKLEELFLCGGGITDTGLLQLKCLKNLRRLHLACETSEAGEKELKAALPDLKIMKIYDEPVVGVDNSTKPASQPKNDIVGGARK